MNAIFASKLFRSSTRQDKIRAALADPVNMELVQQLRSYLDEPYQKLGLMDPQPEEPETDTSEAPAEAETGEESSSTAESNSPAPSHNSAPSRVSAPISDPMDIPGLNIEDESSSEEPPANEPSEPSSNEESVPPEEPVAESTRITSSTDVQDTIEQLKGSINMRQETSGVNRILKKEDEIWIYYEDKVNLNNVMGPVIELVNALGYSNLEFNRLARSDNAIVFQMYENTTQVMEPLENEEDGKKE